MKSVFAFLIFLYIVPVFAQETNPRSVEEQKEKTPEVLKEAGEIAKDSLEKAENFLAGTRSHRGTADYLVMVSYSPLDLVIPSKFGATIGLIQSASHTFELEFMRGSVSVPFIIDDLGKMTDTRISLIGRSYALRNSFNFSYGLSYFDFKSHIGNKYLGSIPGGTSQFAQVDLLQIQALGFNLGFGNRWTFKHNITVGVDWVTWSQPIAVTKEKNVFLDYVTNPNDRDDIETAVKYASYLPRFSFLKFQIGMLF